MDAGILKTDMTYWGKAWTTVLMRIYLLALDMRFFFHPSNFEFTLVKIQAKICFFDAPQLKEISRYFSIFAIFGTRKAPAMFFRNLCGQAALKKILNLFKFISWLVA